MTSFEGLLLLGSGPDLLSSSLELDELEGKKLWSISKDPWNMSRGLSGLEAMEFSPESQGILRKSVSGRYEMVMYLLKSKLSKFGLHCFNRSLNGVLSTKKLRQKCFELK